MFQLLICLFLILQGINLNGQTISGFVKDSATGEGLVGAIIKTVDGKKGAASDTRGFYRLELNQGQQTLQISYLGYLTQQITITLNGKNIKVNFTLSSNTISTKEAVITGQRNNKNVTSTEMSRVELSGEQVKTLPVILRNLH